MYLWYRSAAICIAYLEDVNAVEAGPDTFALDLLGNSRWFTRGWTLQELIAPTVVYFVDASWECFGRKNATDPIWPVFEQPPSLDREIEAISGIPARILDGTAEASECSIAQRLSWASRRNTSGREDLADCLLGLFNVNMPLIYGEGDEAFRRLQNEIFSRHRDESIFAWSLCAADRESGRLGHVLDLRVPRQPIRHQPIRLHCGRRRCVREYDRGPESARPVRQDRHRGHAFLTEATCRFRSGRCVGPCGEGIVRAVSRCADPSTTPRASCSCQTVPMSALLYEFSAAPAVAVS